MRRSLENAEHVGKSVLYLSRPVQLLLWTWLTVEFKVYTPHALANALETNSDAANLDTIVELALQRLKSSTILTKLIVMTALRNMVE